MRQDRLNRIAIIGAGISGLAVARILEDSRSLDIYEKNEIPGGLISCTKENGVLFHRVGGHVFNSKLAHVLNWFWSIFDQQDFILAKRNARIALPDGKIVGYPIENYLYDLDKGLTAKIVSELLTLISEKAPISLKNFETFFLSNFGKTLYDFYFKPYNTKIWKTDLAEIPTDWLTGKLPMPTKEDIIKMNILRQDENQMVHSSFYYPRNDGSQFLADRLASGLPIQYDQEINLYERGQNKWIIRNIEYDAVIYTGDVRQLPTSLPDDVLPPKLKNTLTNLRANGTTVALCEIDASEYSWLYFPDQNILPHRIIYTGNFSKENNGNKKRLTASIEISGYCSKDDFLEELKKIPGNPKMLAYNYHPASYVVHTLETSEIMSDLKNHLDRKNFYLLGRMAEWEYYNMDTAINAAMNIENRFALDERT